jgi:hypothetical protein
MGKAIVENVKVEDVVINNEGPVRIFVIENRVRLYKGKDIVSYEECGSYEDALEVASKLHKDNEGSTYHVTAPKMSDQKRKSIVAAKNRSSIKKALKEIKKSKEAISTEMEELKKQLAILGE